MFKEYLKSPNVLIAIAEAMAKLATFIILPLAGLVLSTSEFNLWAIVFPSVQVLSSAFSFGLPNYILRSFYMYDDQQKKIVNNQIFIGSSKGNVDAAKKAIAAK